MVINSQYEEGIAAALDRQSSNTSTDSNLFNDQPNGRNSPSYGSISSNSEVTVKLYKKRYFILFLYSIITFCNGFQWIQFPIIATILTCYYNVSITTINWASILFMVMYVPFLLPISWMMSFKGLRFTLILGAMGNSLASCIQLVSLQPHQFYVVILSQTMAAIAQGFSVSMPSYIAATWFGPTEVSLACAVGVFANQLGIAFGFVIPPLLVPSRCHDRVAVRTGLWYLAIGQAVINTFLYIIVVLFFEDKPLHPPSPAVAKKPEKLDTTVKSMAIMLKNKHFAMLLIVSGLFASTYYGISTILNQMMDEVFPGQDIAAGWIGAETVITGMLGALLSGFIMDRTHLFRTSLVTVCVMSLLTMVIYTIVASIKVLWLHFFMFGWMGFFMIGALPIAYEFAAEITYPEPEGTSASLLVAMTSFTGIFMTLIATWLQQYLGNLYSNLFFCVCLVVGCFISFFIQCDQKRTAENMSANERLQNPAA